MCCFLVSYEHHEKYSHLELAHFAAISKKITKTNKQRCKTIALHA